MFYCECESPLIDVEHDAGCRRCGRMVDFSALATDDAATLEAAVDLGRRTARGQVHDDDPPPPHGPGMLRDTYAHGRHAVDCPENADLASPASRAINVLAGRYLTGRDDAA